MCPAAESAGKTQPSSLPAHRTTAVLVEAKLATCPAAIRYSGDFEKVKGYLEDKLAKTKGVNQLLNAVKRFSADVPDYLKSINKIIPALVTRDDFGGSWCVNAYLNKRFKDQHRIA